MTASSPSSREPSLADLKWLHALAARLVRDPHAADDAVQDTLVRALEHGPSPLPPPRAWLAAVLLNILRQDWRARARRTARESAARASEGAPSTLEVVETLNLHRRLAEEVHAIDEPYRTAILLRYLRGLTPDEIARDLEVPVKTVRTRLERGLAKLRERVGRDRKAWAAFLPLARPREGIPAPTPLTVLLPMKAKVTAALLCVSLVGSYVVLRDPPEPTGGLEESATLASVEPDDVPLLEGSRDAPRELVEVESIGSGPPVENAAVMPVDRTVRGFVRALDGRGMPGIEVVFEREEGAGFVADSHPPRVTSTLDGRFELPLPDSKGRLDVRDERYACVSKPRVDGEPAPSEPIVVVAPSCDYAGRVVDEAGAPIARASVEIALESLDGFPVQSRDVGGTAVHLLSSFAEGSCDEQGRFRFERVGFVEGARLLASADGFVPGGIELEPGSHEDLELALAPDNASRTIHGVVLEASGAPAKGALVSMGGPAVSCGPDGTFALDCEAWRRSGWLRAARRGSLPAELSLKEALRPSSPEHPILLHLGGAPLSIRGRVLDGSGAPVPDAAVFSPDTTPFGLVATMVRGHAIQGGTTIEGFLTGRTGPWESSVHATTGADGSFVLEGLLDRSYPVFALDPSSLDGVGPLELRAGSEEVEIRLARRPTVPVAGRVVSRSGAPLRDVSITYGRRFAWLADEKADAFASWSFSEPLATTDDEGRFELPELVTDGAVLTLRGPALVIGATFELEGARDPGTLEIAVDAASRFQVVLEHPQEADAFSLEDLEGGQVVMFLEVEGHTISAHRSTIDRGRSGPVLVKEGEYALVLHSGKEEVRRGRRFLSAGGLHAITP